MRIYQVIKGQDELFVVGDRLCAYELVEYRIEPENGMENASLKPLIAKLLDESINVYFGYFFLRKVERINGEIIQTTRPTYVVQVKKGTNLKYVKNLMKELLLCPTPLPTKSPP